MVFNRENSPEEQNSMFLLYMFLNIKISLAFYDVVWLEELQSALQTTTLLLWNYALISTGFAWDIFFIIFFK